MLKMLLICMLWEYSYSIWRKWISLFTILKRGFHVYLNFISWAQQHKQRKQSEATFHIESNLIPAQDVCVSLHLYKTAFPPLLIPTPSQFPQQGSYFTVLLRRLRERECIRLSIIYQSASLHKVLLFFSTEVLHKTLYCNEKQPRLLRYKSNYS